MDFSFYSSSFHIFYHNHTPSTREGKEDKQTESSSILIAVVIAIRTWTAVQLTSQEVSLMWKNKAPQEISQYVSISHLSHLCNNNVSLGRVITIDRSIINAYYTDQFPLPTNHRITSF